MVDCICFQEVASRICESTVIWTHLVSVQLEMYDTRYAVLCLTLFDLVTQRQGEQCT